MKMQKKLTAFSGILLSAAVLGACGTGSPAASLPQDASAPVSSQAVSSLPASSAPASSAPSSAAGKEPGSLSGEDASAEVERQVLDELEQLTESGVSLSAPSSAPASSVSVPAAGYYTGAVSVKVPAASGITAYQSGGSVVDASNTAEGYVMIKHSGSSKRLKVQIRTAAMTYNYDLNNGGNFEVFPLQMGSGAYTARVMENVTGSSYRELFHADFDVALSSDTVPFLYPNQYVNYSASSSSVKKSYDLCIGAKTDLDKLKAIYGFMISTIKYDYDKAKTVKSGYLPDVDDVLKSQKGICFDYSALMAAMLRAQNVPTKLVVGSADALAQNHSWNEVYLQGKGWITVKIQNTQTGWKLMDATFGASNSVGSSYTAARVY